MDSPSFHAEYTKLCMRVKSGREEIVSVVFRVESYRSIYSSGLLLNGKRPGVPPCITVELKSIGITPTGDRALAQHRLNFLNILFCIGGTLISSLYRLQSRSRRCIRLQRPVF